MHFHAIAFLAPHPLNWHYFPSNPYFASTSRLPLNCAISQRVCYVAFCLVSCLRSLHLEHRPPNDAQSPQLHRGLSGIRESKNALRISSPCNVLPVFLSYATAVSPVRLKPRRVHRLPRKLLAVDKYLLFLAHDFSPIASIAALQIAKGIVAAFQHGNARLKSLHHVQQQHTNALILKAIGHLDRALFQPSLKRSRLSGN